MLWLGFLLVAAPLQGQVHVVDRAGGAGADFTTIAAAVEAAAEGDIVLVRSGNYGFDEISISAKSLAVVAEGGAEVRTSSLTLSGLARDQWSLVQGIRIESQGITGFLRDNQGPVWLERCIFRSLLFVNDHEALRVWDCASTLLIGCDIEAPETEPGLDAMGSRIGLFESMVRGGPAALLRNTRLSLEGSQVHGIDGRDGFVFLPNGGDGSDGLVLENGSEAWIQDSILLGGAGGMPYGSGLPGADGEALVVTSGALHSRAGPSKTLEVPSPVRAGDLITFTVRGEPGDLVWLHLARKPLHLKAQRSPMDGHFLGRIPAGGELVSSPFVPRLPAGLEGMVLFCQASVREADGGRFGASAPSALVLLHRSRSLRR